MKTIHKYELQITDRQTVLMPADAKILSVQRQGERESLCVWVEVNPEAVPTNFTFRIIGTGHEMPKIPLQYIDTVQMYPFVWHVYRELA